MASALVGGQVVDVVQAVVVGRLGWSSRSSVVGGGGGGRRWLDVVAQVVGGEFVVQVDDVTSWSVVAVIDVQVLMLLVVVVAVDGGGNQGSFGQGLIRGPGRDAVGCALLVDLLGIVGGHR